MTTQSKFLNELLHINTQKHGAHAKPTKPAPKKSLPPKQEKTVNTPNPEIQKSINEMITEVKDEIRASLACPLRFHEKWNCGNGLIKNGEQCCFNVGNYRCPAFHRYFDNQLQHEIIKKMKQAKDGK